MSLRPMIFAADLEPLLKIAESSDTTMAERVGDHYWSRLMNRNGWTQYSVRQVAHSLLSGAIVGKPENDMHVHMVFYLAGMLGIGKEGSAVADGHWNVRGWAHYAEHVFPHLEKWPQELFANLFGRPLFGMEIQSSWSYYGYLLASEVEELLVALHAITPLASVTGHDPEFHQELISWLQAVLNRRSDLWLYAS